MLFRRDFDVISMLFRHGLHALIYMQSIHRHTIDITSTCYRHTIKMHTVWNYAIFISQTQQSTFHSKTLSFYFMNTLFCVWRTAMGKQSSHSMLRLHRMPWAQVNTSTCLHNTMLHQICTCTERDSHFLSNMFHEGTPIGRYY